MPSNCPGATAIEARARSTRIFLVVIVLASALAPMACGYLVAYFDWRTLFTCSTVGGAVFVGVCVPSGCRTAASVRRRSAALMWPCLVFALALSALQIVAQQLRFELFNTTPLMPLTTPVGLIAVGRFAWHQWHDARPLARLNALREGPYRQGIVLYAFYYFISNAIGFLVSRRLQSGLGYPV